MPPENQNREPLGLHIQYMIAEQLIFELDANGESDPKVHDTLLALRLTSLGLARFHKVNAQLFGHINLRATCDYLRRAVNTSTSITSISPFVRKVTFTPSPHSLSLSNPDFQSLLKIVFQHPGGPREKLSVEPLPITRYRDKYWGHYYPFTQDQMEHAYLAYLVRARHDAAIVNASAGHTSALQRQWTSDLLLLPHVTEVCLSMGHHPLQPLHHFDARGQGSWQNQCGPCIRPKRILNDTWGADAMALCAVAIGSLENAGTKIKSLAVDCELAQESADWSALSLGDLESLRFFSANFYDNGMLVGQEQIIESVRKVFQKCNGTLTNLEFTRPWITDHTDYALALDLDFPCLRALKIGSMYLEEAFPRVFDQLPALESVHLCECWPIWNQDDETFAGWKAIFEAVRNHSNPIHLTLDRCFHWRTCDQLWEERTLVYDPTEAEAVISKLGDDDIEKAVLEFLMELEEWTDVLEVQWEPQQWPDD